LSQPWQILTAHAPAAPQNRRMWTICLALLLLQQPQAQPQAQPNPQPNPQPQNPQVPAVKETVVVKGTASIVNTDPAGHANATVLRGADLDALSDDPDELEAQLKALAGAAAGPSGARVYVDGFTGGKLPPKSSIAEIRINLNPYSAEYDTPGAARIEVITKPAAARSTDASWAI
jgi:hypothetical protein